MLLESYYHSLDNFILQLQLLLNRRIPSRRNRRTLINWAAGQNRASQSILRKTHGCEEREPKRYLNGFSCTDSYRALYNMPDWIIVISDMYNRVWDERALSPFLKCLDSALSSSVDMVLIFVLYWTFLDDTNRKEKFE